ncbi:hypothetical protein HPB52_006350 [Rhipicephalus sanguineus]|uniref:Uncharacterized protein n=1 Tax=Rhipicephalus sanguineus TaxID=34632 RepID=A0A9D4SXY7_RHISA|nr:hypothetical protein HPB52_006350 [Rhipicephalus sanguineus]
MAAASAPTRVAASKMATRARQRASRTAFAAKRVCLLPSLNKLGHLATSRNCPAKNTTCQYCRIKGHFAAGCRKRQASVQEVAPVQDADSGTATVLSVQAAQTSPRDLRIPVVIG